MITQKRLLCIFMWTEKEGKRAKYWRDRERYCVRGRASEGRGIASVQKLTFA